MKAILEVVGLCHLMSDDRWGNDQDSNRWDVEYGSTEWMKRILGDPCTAGFQLQLPASPPARRAVSLRRLKRGGVAKIPASLMRLEWDLVMSSLQCSLFSCWRRKEERKAQMDFKCHCRECIFCFLPNQRSSLLERRLYLRTCSARISPHLLYPFCASALSMSPDYWQGNGQAPDLFIVTPLVIKRGDSNMRKQSPTSAYDCALHIDMLQKKTVQTGNIDD